MMLILEEGVQGTWVASFESDEASTWYRFVKLADALYYISYMASGDRNYIFEGV